jgi:hypothetical protein
MFALALRLDSPGEKSGRAIKFGEIPAFGPPVPSRLIKLVGRDREEFLKGRRCENQGLGIGAFSYYRRVVENQKDRIIGEILQVAQKVGAGQNAIAELEAAIAETRFSKALGMVTEGLPQSLLIAGQNPLALLHSALSEGLHNQSDEHCLELATAVRTVLAEMSDRMGQILKDEEELKRAVATLVKARTNARTEASKAQPMGSSHSG